MHPSFRRLCGSDGGIGRHAGLKILWAVMPVPVRPRFRVPKRSFMASLFFCSVREVCFADYAMVIYSFHKRACTLYIPLAGYALLSYFALRIAVLTYRRLREQDYVYCSTIVCAYMRSRYCFAVRPRFRVPKRSFMASLFLFVSCEMSALQTTQW